MQRIWTILVVLHKNLIGFTKYFIIYSWIWTKPSLRCFTVIKLKLVIAFWVQQMHGHSLIIIIFGYFESIFLSTNIKYPTEPTYFPSRETRSQWISNFSFHSTDVTHLRIICIYCDSGYSVLNCNEELIDSKIKKTVILFGWNHWKQNCKTLQRISGDFRNSDTRVGIFIFVQRKRIKL